MIICVTGHRPDKLYGYDLTDPRWQDLKNIFKRFYRSDTAHTQRGSYGLGLSIAQNIILRHRGRIWAESKSGRNTFFVELPVK